MNDSVIKDAISTRRLFLMMFLGRRLPILRCTSVYVLMDHNVIFCLSKNWEGMFELHA